MKTVAASILLLGALSAIPSASPASPSSPAPSTTPSPAPRAKAHGLSLTGRVSRIDRAKMTLTLRDAAGLETLLSWTAATKVSGGELKVGQPVTLRYLDKDARHIATTIRVSAPAGAAPSATAAAPASPASPSPAPARFGAPPA